MQMKYYVRMTIEREVVRHHSTVSSPLTVTQMFQKGLVGRTNFSKDEIGSSGSLLVMKKERETTKKKTK